MIPPALLVSTSLSFPGGVSLLYQWERFDPSRDDTTQQTLEAITGVEKIVFVSRRDGPSQIYIMNTDGSDQKRLSTHSGDAFTPAISPDGTRIAFVSNSDGTSRIFLMGVDGSNQRRLTDVANSEEEPTWSPDGLEIYYRAGLENGSVAIFAAGADGGVPRQITDNALRYKEPSVSPDGADILFNSTGHGNAEIWLMSIAGADQHRIPNTPDWGMTPVWFPDGKRIAYALLDPATFTGQVHVMDFNGSGDAVITRAGVTSEYPCWSPDGKRIAFQTSRDGNFEIYVMNADGSEPRRLTNNAAFDGRPSWGSVRR